MTTVIRKGFQTYSDLGGNATWTTRQVALTGRSTAFSVGQFWAEVSCAQNKLCDFMYVVYVRDSNLGDLDWSNITNWSQYRDRIWAYGIGLPYYTGPFRELIEPKTSRALKETENLYLWWGVRSKEGAASTVGCQAIAYTILEVD